VGLGRSAVIGSLSTFGGGVAGFLLRFALNMVFARAIAPEEFGVYAQALVASSFVTLPLSVTFGQALVQFDAGTPGLVDTVLRLTWRQAGLVMALALVVWPVLAALRGADVGVTFVAVAAGTIFGSVAAAYEGILLRRMRFPFVALVRLVGIAVSLGGALALCWVAPGPFVYVVRDGLPFVIGLAVLWLVVRRQRSALVEPVERGWDADTAKRAWRFGRELFVNRSLELLLNRLDSLLVGAVLGSVPLANYEQARYLSGLPAAAVAPFSMSVGLRTFSAVRHDEPRLARAFALVQWAITRFLIAFSVAVAIAPDLAVRLVFGPTWAEAAEPLRFLALWIWLSPVQVNQQILLIALQRWRGIRVSFIVASAVLGIVMIPAALTGWPGLAPIAQTAGVAASFLVMIRATPRALRVRLGVYLRPLLAAAVAVASGLVTRALLPDDVSAMVGAAIGLAVGGVVLALVIVALEGRAILAELRYLRDVVRRRDGAAPPPGTTG